MNRYVLIFILFNLTCFAQTKHTLVTRTERSGESSRLSFDLSAKGDSLSIKNNTGSHVYRVNGDRQFSFLIIDADTIKIGEDSYHLFPGYYKKLKLAVTGMHSVIAVLQLLEDEIGDYHIEDASPLFLFEQQTGKHIQSATVITKRGQADMTDSWVCVYRYRSDGKLTAVSAADGRISRLTKKIHYKRNKLVNIQFSRNIEDRQITDLSVDFLSDHLHLKKKTLETGKNRTSNSDATLKRTYL